MTNKAAIKNSYLEPFGVLVGTWKTVGKHPYMPDDELHGTVSFEWIDGGAFMKMSSTIDHSKIPDGISLFGSDNDSKRLIMIYFDERDISRIYGVSLEDNVLKWWRDDKRFSQRFTVRIAESGERLTGKGEMCRDGKTWEDDLSLIYTRIK